MVLVPLVGLFAAPIAFGIRATHAHTVLKVKVIGGNGKRLVWLVRLVWNCTCSMQ